MPIVARPGCRRVDSMSGAANDSVSLISFLHFGQMIVGSAIASAALWGNRDSCAILGGIDILGGSEAKVENH